MSQTTRGSTVVPCVQYRDAGAMIDWLCEVIGFEKKTVYPNDSGGVAHAELTLDGGMLMVSSAPPPGDTSEWSRIMRLPADLDNVETQSPSLYVPDPDAVYARVKAHGGTIIMDIEDKHYGGRGFGCRDPEGHVWFIGSYDPWSS